VKECLLPCTRAIFPHESTDPAQWAHSHEKVERCHFVGSKTLNGPTVKELLDKTVANHVTLLTTLLRTASTFKVPWLTNVPKFHKPKVALFSRDYHCPPATKVQPRAAIRADRPRFSALRGTRTLVGEPAPSEPAERKGAEHGPGEQSGWRQHVGDGAPDGNEPERRERVAARLSSPHAKDVAALVRATPGGGFGWLVRLELGVFGAMPELSLHGLDGFAARHRLAREGGASTQAPAEVVAGNAPRCAGVAERVSGRVGLVQ
jgi:hypothetical protein